VQALVTAIGGRTNHKTLSFSGKNQDGACLRSATYFGDRSVKHSFETTSRRKEQQAWQIHGKVTPAIQSRRFKLRFDLSVNPVCGCSRHRLRA
jgi:hypothetical protein